MFTSLTNKSDAKDLYPTTGDPDSARDLFHRRVTSDYNNKHGVKYVPPPVVKDILKKNTFVHNCLANKSKNNVEHFENIYNKKILTQRKRKIIGILHERRIDFRMLQALKNALFDLDELEDNHLVSLESYRETAHYEMNKLLDGELGALVLQEIGSDCGTKVDLAKLNDLVDLFFYLPTKQKPNARNESESMWFIMSSNCHGGHDTGERPDQGGPLARILDLLWIKIAERFPSIHEAYRYFDVNFNNRVSFNEFQKGLDNMRIKFQVSQMSDIFQYLDRGDKGYISYGDFCELAEEKRRHLDPVTTGSEVMDPE